MNRASFVCLLIACSLLIPGPAAGSSAPERILVDEGSVTLADVLDLPSDSPLYQKASRVVLADAPSPGCELTLKREYVVARAKATGFELTGDNVPERVAIVRRTRTLHGEQIDEAVSSYLKNTSPYGHTNTDVCMISGSQDVLIPEGAIRVDVSLADNFPYAGRQQVLTTVYVNDRRVRSQWIKVQIVAHTSAVVAARDLNKGRRIRPEDLAAQDVVLGSDDGVEPCRVVTDPELLLGQRLRRPIAKGGLVTLDAVVQPPTLERGDMVTIVAVNENLRVTGVGQVLGPASVGEVVRVKNTASGKVLSAEVVDSKTVLVIF